MRGGKLVVLVGLGLLLAATGPQAGRCQSVAPIGRPRLFGPRFSASDIKNVPIDTSKAVAPVPEINQGPLSNFHLSSLLGFMGFAGPRTTRGISPLPPPSSFPSTNYPNSFKPLPPVNSLPKTP